MGGGRFWQMCRRGHLNERSRHGKVSAVRVRPGWGRPVYGSIPRGNQGGSGGSFTAPGVGMNQVVGWRRCQRFSGVALFLSFGGGKPLQCRWPGK